MSIANLTIEPHVQAEIMKLVETAYDEHSAAVEQLTRKQMYEAFTQAIASGDFMRHVHVDNHSQAVTYMPYRELEVLWLQIKELKAENDHLRQLNIEASRLASEAAVRIVELEAELAELKGNEKQRSVEKMADALVEAVKEVGR